MASAANATRPAATTAACARAGAAKGAMACFRRGPSPRSAARLAYSMPVAISGAITFAATNPSIGTGSNAMLATSVTKASPAKVAGPRFHRRIASAYHASARSAGTLLDSRPKA